MKTYFISFDYRGPGYDRYMSGIFRVDLKAITLIDFCRQLIKEQGALDIDPYSATVEVNACNNVDL